MTKVLGLLGLPGAGKTTAYEHLIEQDGFTGFQMSDIAGSQYRQMQNKGLRVFPDKMREQIKSDGVEDDFTPTGSPSEEIADWVDSVLSINPTYFAEIAATRVDNSDDNSVVVVDGIRSVSDVELITKPADKLTLVYLHTPFSVRLQRITDRDRDGEQNVGVQYLVDRDEQELSWGVNEILANANFSEESYTVEYFYANHSSTESFRNELLEFVTGETDLAL